MKNFDNKYNGKKSFGNKPGGKSFGDKKAGEFKRNESFSKRHEDDENAEIIYGRNSVNEAIKAGRTINKILFAGEPTGSLGAIFALAKENNIMYAKVTKEKLDELCDGGNHQGVACYMAAADYCDVDDMFKLAEEKGEAPFIIILDEIQDAGNFGAIIRTADAVGAHGIIIPKRRAVPLTAAVAKTSSGAVSHVKIARVPNVPNEIDNLKAKGLWIAGTDLTGETVFYDADLKGPLGIVIGSEGNGMGRLVREKCDYVLTIPMTGAVSSLNASVAAGVVLYEAFRQRRTK